MKVVALVAQKGGTGKSTIAMHLGVCAARTGQSVALIDLDPQRTVSDWSEMREEAKIPDDPLEGAVVAARVQELPGLLRDAESQGADLVILDTAGRSDVATSTLMDLADLVLLPCRCSFPDLKASLATVHQLPGGKKAFFVLNAVPATGTRNIEAREALKEFLPVAPVELRHYVAYGDALNDGRSVEELDPRSKASGEIRALYAWAASA